MSVSRDLTGKMSTSIKSFLTNPMIKVVIKNKAMIIGMLYTISPIDLVPDVIPILGQLDDVFLLLACVANLLESHSNGNLTVDSMIKDVSSVTAEMHDGEIRDTLDKVVSVSSKADRIINGKTVVMDIEENNSSVDSINMNDVSEVDIKRRCPRCGSIVNIDDTFCVECGVKL